MKPNNEEIDIVLFVMNFSMCQRTLPDKKWEFITFILVILIFHSQSKNYL